MCVLPALLVVWYFTGSVILFQDVKEDDSGTPVRKKRDVLSHEDMLLATAVSKSDRIEMDGLLGYSVTSGKFLHSNKTHYAAGAPQSADSHGNASYKILCVVHHQISVY